MASVLWSCWGELFIDAGVQINGACYHDMLLTQKLPSKRDFVGTGGAIAPKPKPCPEMFWLQQRYAVQNLATSYTRGGGHS